MTGKRILVLEDEASVLNLIVRIMRNEGYKVVPVGTCRDALDKIQKTDFDLVICDLKMPDFDGKALYERIQASHPRLRGRFVFVTGDTVSRDNRRFLNKAGCPYLLKPFCLDDLKQTVVRVLGKKNKR